MKILNVGFYADFDMFSSAGYFKIEDNTNINELNRDFIIDLVKKRGLKILIDNKNHLKIVNFKEKKKYNIRFENNTISSDNCFNYEVSCDDYTQYLRDAGMEEIKAARVIVNSD